MEENLSWKIVYFAAIFSLVVLGIAYYLITPRESPYFSAEKIEKIAELKNARIEGRKEGQRLWVLKARDGWTSKDRQTTFLNHVYDGKMYSNDKLSLYGLSAPQVKVQGRNDLIEAFFKDKQRLKARIDMGKLSSSKKDKSDWVSLSADYIKFWPQEKRSEISGHVILVKKEWTITCDRLAIDHNLKNANLSGNIHIRRKDGLINTDKLDYIGEQEQLNLDQNTFFNLRSGKIRTRIKCQRAVMFNDAERDILLYGSLEVTQGKKIAIAREGNYSRALGGLDLKGQTKTVIEKAQALLNPDTALKLKNADTKTILKEKTVVTSNTLFFSTRTGDARATGSVEVTQRGREAKADSATYDDKKEVLTLAGNVFMKKIVRGGKQDWVKCREVSVSVPKETFEAVGAVEAEFKF